MVTLIPIPMTPQFRKFVKALSIIAGIVFLGWMTRIISGAAAKSMLDCNHPCLKNATSDADCRPLEVGLEIKTLPDARGRSTVWYRASAVNNSCVDADFQNGFFARDLDASPQQDVDDSYIQVSDESGQIIVPVDPPASRGGDERIRPYRSFFQGKEVYAHTAGDDFVHLLPGAKIWTSAEVLSPYRMRIEDRHGQYGDATYGVREAVKIAGNGFVAPPEGFRRLTGYEFRHPGRYKARFIFNQKTQVHWRPANLGRGRLALLSVLSLISGQSVPEKEGFRHIRAETGLVEFHIAK